MYKAYEQSITHKCGLIFRAISAVYLLCLLCSSVFAHTGVINVQDPPYLARPNDQIDDTQAFQSALDDARSSELNVYVPAGNYIIGGHLTVPARVTLIGSWEGPPGPTGGTILNATGGAGDENGTPLISLEYAAGVKGLVIQYPNQPDNTAPVPYPWTIRALTPDCRVENVMLVRAYNGLDFGSAETGRHFINNVSGSPLRRGIYVSQSVDVGRINNVRFDGTGITPGSALDSWKRQNGEAIILKRADWEWITSCHLDGYKTGIGLYPETGPSTYTGVPNYIQVMDTTITQTETPVLVDQCSVINLNQCTFQGKAIKILENNVHPVRFAQCTFSPILGTGSLVEASGLGRVSFVDCTFIYWDTLKSLAPAIYADCGSLLVKGCEFGTAGKDAFLIGTQLKRHIQLTSNVASAVISGNRMRYGSNIVNQSTSAQIVIRNNLVDNVDVGYRQPKPYGMPISSLATSIVYDRYVRTWGKVTNAGDGYQCTITDGAFSANVVANDMFYVPFGAYMAVNGYCGSKDGQVIIVPDDIYRSITIYQ